MAKKTIGLDIQEPKEKCEDMNCPFHSNLSLRGKYFDGEVTSEVFQKTVSVSWERKTKIQKYERYQKKKTKVRAHSTPCIPVQKGDKVRIMECRPLSKTKKFVVVKVNN